MVLLIHDTFISYKGRINHFIMAKPGRVTIIVNVIPLFIIIKRVNRHHNHLAVAFLHSSSYDIFSIT